MYRVLPQLGLGAIRPSSMSKEAPQGIKLQLAAIRCDAATQLEDLHAVLVGVVHAETEWSSPCHHGLPDRYVSWGEDLHEILVRNINLGQDLV